MLLTPTISRAPESEPGLDQARLYALGLEHVRRLARRIWTDHNVHDPGITTLELLCYALTELAYRADFPVEDLLAKSTDNLAGMSEQFFTARQILPNRALTRADYRKLAIDLVGVKNAWIEPASLTLYADTLRAELRADDPGTPGVREVTVRGRYRVLVEYMDDITTAEARTAVKDAVLERMAANRNLCEDFVAVGEVGTQDYALCAELELELDADPALVAATVEFEVQRYLSPPVSNYSLSEMLARTRSDGTPWTAPEIFDGPRLTHGFIDDEELEVAELRREIRLSDIISVIMDIPGVRAIRDIVVSPLVAGSAVAPPDKWRLAVPAGSQPRLSTSKSRLVYYKRGMPVPADAVRIDALRGELEAELRDKLETAHEDDLPIPLGRYRELGAYRSFQLEFPQIYGLSERGLPARSTTLRKAQALQLKAYLLWFDQVLADYFAQLANVRELFSRTPSVGNTYFSQVVRSIPEYEKLYDAAADGDLLLQSLFEGSEDAIARRDQLVDHLLSRFAEEFHHYAAIMASAFGASAASTLKTKYRFLRELPALGADRALAYDYRRKAAEDRWGSPNISGLEQRLARLLGIANPARRNLTGPALDAHTEAYATVDGDFRFRVLDPETTAVQLDSSAAYPTQEEAESALARAIEIAQRPSSYRRTSIGVQAYSFEITEASVSIAVPPQPYSSAELRDRAIDALILDLGRRYSTEGMYVVEHLLLLPEEPGDPFLPICVDPSCADCADDDPYSYRLHVVLPAYAGRFADMDFRRFAEETIRREVPAHLLPKVCWIDEEQMAVFELAYRAWIDLRASIPSENRTATLEAFVKALYSVRNVYPEQKLHDCDADPSKPSFVLGRSALGSFDPP